ncbi:MAG: TetR/AcrR family transcriptional regulator [Variovorax sp.]|nr:MAG: TetR/AcrR family transcriptional regulator [Variovorax sp.]
MQAAAIPRTNRDRTEATRHALLEAARSLFVSEGYGGTSTPQVSAAAGTTRGALYHHFVDKRDLFRAVLLRESQAVAAEIEAAAPADLLPRDALVAGADAYLAAMSVPGRTRLLLIEGPAVLGMAELMAMDEGNAAATLREGLAAAAPASEGVPMDALARLLSAAFDRAALEIDGGADAAEVRAAVIWLLKQVCG